MDNINNANDYSLIKPSFELQNSSDNKLSEIIDYAIDTIKKNDITVRNSDIIASNKIIKESHINLLEIFKEGVEINETNPEISKQDLLIELLHIIAKNKKYKKMSKIAKEMINESWWDKNA